MGKNLVDSSTKIISQIKKEYNMRNLTPTL